MRKSAFYEIGGLDEDFFAHQEEIDLCWRLQNQDYRIKYVSNSKVYHVGGATLADMNPKKTFFNFRNSLFMLLKNVEKSKIFQILLLRMLLDSVAGVKFLIEGKFSHLFGILEAHFSFYKQFRRMLKKRSKGLKSLKYYEITSIVYAHYLLKKNKFTELKK